MLQREIRPPAGAKTPNTSPEGSPETERATKFAALNPDLDRSPAILGESVPGKMKIQYQLPRTNAIKRLFFRQFNNGRNIDWKNIEHIRALNKWRTQVFRYVAHAPNILANDSKANNPTQTHARKHQKSGVQFSRRRKRMAHRALSTPPGDSSQAWSRTRLSYPELGRYNQSFQQSF